MAMDPTMIVRVTNVGDTTFRDLHDSKPYVIEPGDSIHLELGAARTWLGVNDEGPHEREEAVKKIMLRWGFTPLSEGTWDDYRPQIEVFHQNTQDRIWFPADDPEGKHAVYAPVVPAVGDQARYEARIAALEEKLDMALSGNTPLAESPAQTLDDIPKDKVRRTPVKA